MIEPLKDKWSTTLFKIKSEDIKEEGFDAYDFLGDRIIFLKKDIKSAVKWMKKKMLERGFDYPDDIIKEAFFDVVNE